MTAVLLNAQITVQLLGARCLWDAMLATKITGSSTAPVSAELPIDDTSVRY